jgi:hypothetical protein
MVRKRRKPEPPEQAADDTEFFADMFDLLDDPEHMDAVFVCYKHGGSDVLMNSSGVGSRTNTPEKMFVDNRKLPSATPDGSGSIPLDRCVSGDGGIPEEEGGNYKTVEIRAHKRRVFQSPVSKIGIP